MVLEAADAELRRFTARLRPLPDFLIVGAQKAGTTSLFYYLDSHPSIAGARPKEVHYFTRHYQRGESWYRKHFALRRRALAFEATPAYLAVPEVAQRIHRDLPGVRLIVILREPVSRAWSHYKHNLRKGRETRSFEVAVQADVDAWEREGLPFDYDDSRLAFAYVRRSIYSEQIQHYLRLFPDLLLLRAKDLFVNTQATLDQVTDFLGVHRFRLQDAQAANAGTYDDACPIRRELTQFFRPHNERLTRILGATLWPETDVTALQDEREGRSPASG